MYKKSLHFRHKHSSSSAENIVNNLYRRWPDWDFPRCSWTAVIVFALLKAETPQQTYTIEYFRQMFSFRWFAGWFYLKIMCNSCECKRTSILDIFLRWEVLQIKQVYLFPKIIKLSMNNVNCVFINLFS